MDNPHTTSLVAQLLWLLVLAIPIACVSWTITHEEIFREPREYCHRQAKGCGSWWKCKLFYGFTCEYCLSHYVTIFFVALTNYRLLMDDWRGYVISVFALVWVANVYMNFYARLRVHIRGQKAQATVHEKEVELKEKDVELKEQELGSGGDQVVPFPRSPAHGARRGAES